MSADTSIFLGSVKVVNSLPYGADQRVVEYYEGTNNVHTITYKRAGVTLKTRTLIYLNGGAANDDLLIDDTTV